MPLLTLTTDFGTRDPYLAQMKGVLLGEGPADLRIVDLSHELGPFDVQEAALFVRSALPRFPPGTVHLVVVDPGVGSARKPIVACVRDQLLVGPDNGVFGYLFDGSEQVFVLEPARFGRDISSTFHGRDLFAPAAARLLGGAPASALGSAAETYQRMVFPLVEVRGNTLVGRILHIDRFGNLITNVPESTLRAFVGEGAGEPPQVYVAERPIVGLVDHYAQGKVGELLALIGSSGLLEVAVREGHAGERLGARVGWPVRVQRS